MSVNAHARTYRRGVYKFLCVHGYIILLPSCTMYDRANSMSSSSRVEVLERSSRVRVLERSNTSTSARVLEEGSDLRVKLEYECSSARVSHIETREYKREYSTFAFKFRVSYTVHVRAVYIHVYRPYLLSLDALRIRGIWGCGSVCIQPYYMTMHYAPYM